ncbi:hypothetical protein A7979_11555 [Rothia nasimurium]|uniref:RHS repeat-associated core domain-containing protein n=6 Tax=Rothia TaxID=32207 RepID=A0A1Y1RQL5_9MICC|nr:hypothetical protein A7979_11555 [Rothia nasimurium]
MAYGYDEASQLVSVTGGHRQVAARYEYDVCGRLTRSVGADGVERVFAYDEASQLVSVTASSGEVTIFLYDGLGRRVRQEDADGAVREFAYGPTGYLSTVELGDGTEGEHTVHRIEVDALGEIVAVDGVALGWDVTAAVPVLVSVGEVSVGVGPVMSWRVARSMGEGDPYGVPGSGGVAGADVSGVGSGGVLAGFALSADGIPVVAGIELMGARGYDPVTASFLSVDPLVPVVGAAWGSNPYSFAGNNPVMMSDPWGLRPATDADLAAYREANQGALADAGDWVADNWEYVAAGAMVVAGVALMFTGVGGPAGLAILAASSGLISAGASTAIQKYQNGSVNWAEVAKEGAIGFATGFVGGGTGALITRQFAGKTVAARATTGFTNRWHRAVAGAASGGGEGAVSGAVEYSLSDGPHTMEGYAQSMGVNTLAGMTPGGIMGYQPRWLTGLSGNHAKNFTQVGVPGTGLQAPLYRPSYARGGDSAVYRAGDINGYRTGSYWTAQPEFSVSAAKRDLALPDRWVNPKTGGPGDLSIQNSVFSTHLPEGVPMYRGVAGPQHGFTVDGQPMYVPGGGEQIYVEAPHDLDPALEADYVGPMHD